MVVTVLWVVGLILESLIVIRAVAGCFIREYRFFYSYLMWVLFRDLGLLAVYHRWPTGYAYIYWYSQSFSVLLGFAIVWEVYRLALRDYPGASRIARSLLTVVFVLTICRVVVFAANEGRWLFGKTTLETEKEFRVVQAALLAALIALLVHYAIPLGRNLMGITVGYGAFLATSLVQLTMREALGDVFQTWWQFIQPISYILVLSVWCVALWSFKPARSNLSGEPRIEVDYRALANATKKHLKEARAYIERTVGS